MKRIDKTMTPEPNLTTIISQYLHDQGIRNTPYGPSRILGHQRGTDHIIIKKPHHNHTITIRLHNETITIFNQTAWTGTTTRPVGTKTTIDINHPNSLKQLAKTIKQMIKQ